ncbi:MAG: response regulator [Francisellaceae bacterium]
MKTGNRILIVDDDHELGTLLSEFLSQFNYKVNHVRNGAAMKRIMKQELFDVILLDIMLPGDNGFDLCRQLREESKVPIIIISALEQDSDRILGLEMGADDYLPKPFNTRELLARIKALLRRTQGELKSEGMTKGQLVAFDRWRLDRHTHVLIDDNDVAIALSHKEYQLLELFMSYPNQILSRDQIMENLYDRLADPYDRTIDVLIGRLRKKLEIEPKNPMLLMTVRGEGYKFNLKINGGLR